MKRHLPLGLLLACSLSLASSVLEAKSLTRAPDPIEVREKHLKNLTETLNLTPEQQSKVRAILVAIDYEMAPFRIRNGVLSEPERKKLSELENQKLAELEKKKREKIAAILTQSQKEKFGK